MTTSYKYGNYIREIIYLKLKTSLEIVINSKQAIATKIKYLKTNLTRNVQNLYEEKNLNTESHKSRLDQKERYSLYLDRMTQYYE